VLEYVELINEASKMISAQNAGGYTISFISFANYASIIDVGASNGNLLILARYSSLKTLFSIFRLQSNINKHDKKTISERYNLITDAGERTIRLVARMSLVYS
jgi:hypothetical protein